MDNIAQTACDLIDKGETFVLATIFSHTGSTPRSSGSRMIVTKDGRGIGTVGGGLLEAETMSRAAALIGLGQSDILHFDLSHELVATMDMICGGSAEVLLACIGPTDANRAFFESWRRLVETGHGGCLLTRVKGTEKGIDAVVHGVMTARGEIEGDLFLSESEREALAAVFSGNPSTVPVSGGFVVAVPERRACTVHLFGAGHVAVATARMALLAGFRITVADDRAEFANRERFPEAGRVRVLESFDRCFEETAAGPEDYIVILTRGHLHDRTVLARALATGAGYIGMIGSRRKRDAIYGALSKEGFSRADFDRVHSPIGLSIGAETPEEIAVSIVAEMIQHRAGRCG